MQKAFKFRIYPNTEQKTMFAKTFGCSRFIWNKMLADRMDYYKETTKSLHNTPAQYKQEFSWLKEVDSLALANVQMHLDKAYKSFFSGLKKGKKIGFPKFKSKKNVKMMELCMVLLDVITIVIYVIFRWIILKDIMIQQRI